MHVNARKVAGKESHQAVHSGKLGREEDGVGANDFHLLLSYMYCWQLWTMGFYVYKIYLREYM